MVRRRAKMEKGTNCELRATADGVTGFFGVRNLAMHT
jgi:hypothetical protein